MLKIAGIGAAAAAVLLVGFAPVAIADDNTKEYEPQVCGNQPFEGLAVGLLGIDSIQKSEKDEDCDDKHNSDDSDDDKHHNKHDDSRD